MTGWLFFVVNIFLFYLPFMKNLEDFNSPSSHLASVVNLADLIIRAVKLIAIAINLKKIKICLNKSLEILLSINELHRIPSVTWIVIFLQGYYLLDGIASILLKKLIVKREIDLGTVLFYWIVIGDKMMDFLITILTYIACTTFNDVINTIKLLKSNKTFILHDLVVLMTRHWLAGDLLISLSHCFGLYLITDRMTSLFRVIFQIYIFHCTMKFGTIDLFSLSFGVLKIFINLYIQYLIGLESDVTSYKVC